MILYLLLLILFIIPTMNMTGIDCNITYNGSEGLNWIRNVTAYCSNQWKNMIVIFANKTIVDSTTADTSSMKDTTWKINTHSSKTEIQTAAWNVESLRTELQNPPRHGTKEQPRNLQQLQPEYYMEPASSSWNYGKNDTAKRAMDSIYKAALTSQVYDAKAAATFHEEIQWCFLL